MNETNNLKDSWQSLLEIGKSHPPLTAEEERLMTESYFQTNHEKWKEVMILHSIRFAIAQSARYTVRGEDRVDICGKLIEGLTDAANRFDPSKGVRFLTFAGFYMKNAVRNLVDQHLTAVRTNNATLPILDKRVDGADGDSDSTVIDFVGNFQSPDADTVDPASEQKRVAANQSLLEIVSHFCTILNGLKESDRKGRIISAFRLHFADGLKMEDVGARIGVPKSTAKDYLKEAIEFVRSSIRRGRVSTQEWQSFMNDGTTAAQVKDIDESVCQFEEAEILEVRNEIDFLQDSDCDAGESDAASDEEAATSSGCPIETTPRKQVEEDEPIRFQDNYKTVYSDGDFYSGTNNRVIRNCGSDNDKSDQGPGKFGNDNGSVYARIALFKVDKRRAKKKRTIRFAPFYGHFYSEFTRLALMRKTSRLS